MQSSLFTFQHTDLVQRGARRLQHPQMIPAMQRSWVYLAPLFKLMAASKHARPLGVTRLCSLHVGLLTGVITFVHIRSDIKRGDNEELS